MVENPGFIFKTIKIMQSGKVNVQADTKQFSIAIAGI